RTLTLPKVRYIQWGARLKTDDPLKSPTVESVAIEREITRRMEIPENIIVRNWRNPDILYSSTGFTYQDADEPGNRTVIERDDLDALVAGAESEFDAIVKLLHYAATRWVYAGPRLEYPRWNTIDIAERAHSLGDGGMCIQHAAYLTHILTVMGFQARHVNIIAHEVVEVWSNDFDKWVYLDPTQGKDCYLYDTRTGVPLGLREMHEAYYKLYGVSKPIDWMAPIAEAYTRKKDYSLLPIDFSTVDPRVMLRQKENGNMMYYDLCAFLRMMPRNNFSTTALPEPSQQGNGIQWPWDGYVNWYDELGPPKLQYSTHTDRACNF
ncbi:MAG: transglutaminase domain-containing protein, partial [Candidatus Latescibacteria bacterium]|nr:transglutaminase domain-containing protein [Candidatus Latescibacterota bacterium]